MCWLENRKVSIFCWNMQMYVCVCENIQREVCVDGKIQR